MAGVKAGRVHLCRMAGNTVIPYMTMTSTPVALRCGSHDELSAFTFLTQYTSFAFAVACSLRYFGVIRILFECSVYARYAFECIDIVTCIGRRTLPSCAPFIR